MPCKVVTISSPQADCSTRFQTLKTVQIFQGKDIEMSKELKYNASEKMQLLYREFDSSFWQECC